MKIFFTCIAALFIIGACSNDDDYAINPNVLGTWREVARLIGPGDGSGTFEPVEGGEEITLNANGTYTASSSFCYFGFSVGFQPVTGTYNNATIICGESESEYGLPYVLEGENLIVSHLCDEACQAKFERVE